MHRKLARAILPLVVLAVIAALTIGASSKCCLGSFCLLSGGGGGGGGGAGQDGPGQDAGGDTGIEGSHPVTGLALNKWETTIALGSTEQLVATVLPLNATDPSVTWSSTDNSIASVDSTGLVTAVDNGTAIITVTTTDQGLTASCEVTVVRSVVDPVVDPAVEWLELAIRDAGDNRCLAFDNGTEVRFVITMRNVTDRSLVFSCNDAQMYDIRVYSSDNALVWNWAHDRAFAQVVTELRLDPGDEKTYEETWDQKDNEGVQVPAGTYAVHMELVCRSQEMPGPCESGPQQIEIT